MSDKLRNDRFNIDYDHFHKQLVDAGIHKMSQVPSVSMGPIMWCGHYCFTCGKHMRITEKEYYRLEKKLNKRKKHDK